MEVRQQTGDEPGSLLSARIARPAELPLPEGSTDNRISWDTTKNEQRAVLWPVDRPFDQLLEKDFQSYAVTEQLRTLELAWHKDWITYTSPVERKPEKLRGALRKAADLEFHLVHTMITGGEDVDEAADNLKIAARKIYGDTDTHDNKADRLVASSRYMLLLVRFVKRCIGILYDGTKHAMAMLKTEDGQDAPDTLSEMASVLSGAVESVPELRKSTMGSRAYELKMDLERRSAAAMEPWHEVCFGAQLAGYWLQGGQQVHHVALEAMFLGLDVSHLMSDEMLGSRTGRSIDRMARQVHGAWRLDAKRLREMPEVPAKDDVPSAAARLMVLHEKMKDLFIVCQNTLRELISMHVQMNRVSLMMIRYGWDGSPSERVGMRSVVRALARMTIDPDHPEVLQWILDEKNPRYVFSDSDAPWLAGIRSRSDSFVRNTGDALDRRHREMIQKAEERQQEMNSMTLASLAKRAAFDEHEFGPRDFTKGILRYHVPARPGPGRRRLRRDTIPWLARELRLADVAAYQRLHAPRETKSGVSKISEHWLAYLADPALTGLVQRAVAGASRQRNDADWMNQAEDLKQQWYLYVTGVAMPAAAAWQSLQQQSTEILDEVYRMQANQALVGTSSPIQWPLRVASRALLAVATRAYDSDSRELMIAGMPPDSLRGAPDIFKKTISERNNLLEEGKLNVNTYNEHLVQMEAVMSEYWQSTKTGVAALRIRQKALALLAGLHVTDPSLPDAELPRRVYRTGSFLAADAAVNMTVAKLMQGRDAHRPDPQEVEAVSRFSRAFRADQQGYEHLTREWMCTSALGDRVDLIARALTNALRWILFPVLLRPPSRTITLTDLQLGSTTSYTSNALTLFVSSHAESVYETIASHDGGTPQGVLSLLHSGSASEWILRAAKHRRAIKSTPTTEGLSAALRDLERGSVDESSSDLYVHLVEANVGNVQGVARADESSWVILEELENAVRSVSIQRSDSLVSTRKRLDVVSELHSTLNKSELVAVLKTVDAHVDQGALAVPSGWELLAEQYAEYTDVNFETDVQALLERRDEQIQRARIALQAAAMDVRYPDALAVVEAVSDYVVRFGNAEIGITNEGVSHLGMHTIERVREEVTSNITNVAATLVVLGNERLQRHLRIVSEEAVGWDVSSMPELSKTERLQFVWTVFCHQVAWLVAMDVYLNLGDDTKLLRFTRKALDARGRLYMNHVGKPLLGINEALDDPAQAARKDGVQASGAKTLALVLQRALTEDEKVIRDLRKAYAAMDIRGDPDIVDRVRRSGNLALDRILREAAEISQRMHRQQRYPTVKFVYANVEIGELRARFLDEYASLAGGAGPTAAVNLIKRTRLMQPQMPVSPSRTTPAGAVAVGEDWLGGEESSRGPQPGAMLAEILVGKVNLQMVGPARRAPDYATQWLAWSHHAYGKPYPLLDDTGDVELRMWDGRGTRFARYNLRGAHHMEDGQDDDSYVCVWRHSPPRVHPPYLLMLHVVGPPLSLRAVSLMWN